MKGVTQLDKLLWQCYCHYLSIPREEVVSETIFYKMNDETGRRDIPVSRRNVSYRRSKEQWDFIRSSYYYLNVVLDMYSSPVEEYIRYLEPGYVHRGPRKIHKSQRYSQKNGKPNYKNKKNISEEEQRKRDWRKKKKDRRDQINNDYSYRPLERKALKAERKQSKQEIKSIDWLEESSWDDFEVWNGKKAKLNIWTYCW